MITREGEYLTLGKHTPTGWNVTNIHTEEERNVENENKMAEWGYIGKLSGHYEEENNSRDHADRLDFASRKDYDKKLFVTAQINYHKEHEFVEYIPKSKYIYNPACKSAKQKELENLKKYDVYEVVDVWDTKETIVNTN